jgi:hypothetical protein
MGFDTINSKMKNSFLDGVSEYSGDSTEQNKETFEFSKNSEVFFNRLDTTLGYARLYDGTLAADYYHAKSQVKQWFHPGKQADSILHTC